MELHSKIKGKGKSRIFTIDGLSAYRIKFRFIFLLGMGFFTFSCAQFEDQAFSPQELYFFEKYHPNKVVSKSNKDSLTATFYGTSSLLLTDPHEAVLIDGFFSRPEFPSFLLAKLEQIDVGGIKNVIDPSLPQTLQGREQSPLRAVIVLHSHHDHAMDAACIANAYGSILIGSQSTLNIKCEKTIANSKKSATKFGPNEPIYQRGVSAHFYLTMLNSKHSNYGSCLADRVLGIGEDIEKPLDMPVYFTKLREGQSYSVLLDHDATNLRILIHGSAGYKPGVISSAIGEKSVDWLFLSIGGLARAEKDEPGFAKRFLSETINASGAMYVVPIHWDDFTRSVKKTLYPPRARFGNFYEEIKLVEQYINTTESQRRPKLVLLNYNQQVTMSKESRLQK